MQTQKLRIKIINKRWIVKFLPERKFIKRHGKDTQAIALIYKKTLEFNASDTTLEDITHELTHAYLDELCLGRAVSLKKRQLEEAFCEMVSKHATTLLVQALYIKSVYKRYYSETSLK